MESENTRSSEIARLAHDPKAEHAGLCGATLTYDEVVSEAPQPFRQTLLTGTKSRILPWYWVQGSPLPKEV